MVPPSCPRSYVCRTLLYVSLPPSLPPPLTHRLSVCLKGQAAMPVAVHLFLPPLPTHSPASSTSFITLGLPVLPPPRPSPPFTHQALDIDRHRQTNGHLPSVLSSFPPLTHPSLLPSLLSSPPPTHTGFQALRGQPLLPHRVGGPPRCL